MCLVNVARPGDGADEAAASAAAASEAPEAVAAVVWQLSMMIKTPNCARIEGALSAAPAAGSGGCSRLHAAACKVPAQHLGWSAAAAESLRGTPRCRSAAGRGVSNHCNAVELVRECRRYTSPPAPPQLLEHQLERAAAERGAFLRSVCPLSARPLTRPGRGGGLFCVRRARAPRGRRGARVRPD
jgi:hypothetical protein